MILSIRFIAIVHTILYLEITVDGKENENRAHVMPSHTYEELPTTPPIKLATAIHVNNDDDVIISLLENDVTFTSGVLAHNSGTIKPTKTEPFTDPEDVWPLMSIISYLNYGLMSCYLERENMQDDVAQHVRPSAQHVQPSSEFSRVNYMSVASHFTTSMFTMYSIAVSPSLTSKQPPGRNQMITDLYSKFITQQSKHRPMITWHDSLLTSFTGHASLLITFTRHDSLLTSFTGHASSLTMCTGHDSLLPTFTGHDSLLTTFTGHDVTNANSLILSSVYMYTSKPETQYYKSQSSIEFEDRLSEEDYDSFPSPLHLIRNQSGELHSLIGEDLTNICNEESLCKNNKNTATAICYCDVNCIHYGDCCIDVSRDESDKKADAKIIALFSSCVSMKKVSNRGYVMVTSCPPFSKSRLRQKCEVLDLSDTTSFYPVQSKNGIVFRNQYCALCHNATIQLKWNLNFQNCYELNFLLTDRQGTPSLRDMLFQGMFSLSHTCDIVPIQPESVLKPRKCYIVQRKPRVTKMDSNLLANLCSRYQGLVWFKGKVYRNKFCVLYERPLIGTNKILCFADTGDEGSRVTGVALSRIFSVEDNASNDETDVKKCAPGFTHQTFLNKCTPIVCPRFQALSAGTCKAETVRFELKFDISIQLFLLVDGYFNEAVTQFVIKDVVSRYRQQTKFEVRIAGIYLSLCDEYQYQVHLYLMVTLGTTSVISTYKEMKGIHMLNFDSVFYKFLNQNGTTLARYVLLSKSGMKGLKYKCTNIGLYHATDKDISVTCYKSYSPKYMNSNIFNESRGNVAGSANVCILDPYSNKENVFALDVEVLVTYLCTSLSIGFLFASVYTNRESLKTASIPKRLILNSMAMLLLSYTLFMLLAGMDDDYEVCRVCGIILHYVWVCYFVWTSILSFHLYFVIVLSVKQPLLMIVNRTNALYRKYQVIGYTLPMVVVTPIAVVDMLHLNNRQSYGEKVCFLSDPEMLLFGFIVPVSFCLFFNLLCYVITVVYLTRFSFSVKYVRRTYFDHCRTCLKMSLMMSFSWILGILGNVWDSDALRISFIILSSLHGVFMALALGIKIKNKLFKC